MPRLLNDALFAAGVIVRKLKEKKVAANIQIQILIEMKGASGPEPSTFLKLLQNTQYAVQFIEQYLV